MGNKIFREKDKKSKRTKTIRIFQHVITIFLLFLVLIFLTFPGVIGFTMESGQVSGLLVITVVSAIILVSFIMLYKKWELNWD